jgi:N-acetylmuramoyl-L-alanine amidase
MPRTIYLSAGHGGTDPGAVALDGRTEAALALKLRNDVTKLLVARGVSVKNDVDTAPLTDVLAWLAQAALPNDIAVELHFNSAGFNATGVEVIVPEVPSDFESFTARELCVRIASALNLKNRGVKGEQATARKRLGWMRTRCETVLIEVCFLSNKSDLDAFDTYYERLVATLANTLTSLSKS